MSAVYQAGDKALVAEFLTATAPVGRHFTAESLDLPYPVWAVIRAAYFDSAVIWSREQRVATG